MGKLEKNALLFTFGNIFTNAAGFLLLPFYTHLISPEEYGVINILLIISSFLTVTFSLTIYGGISRFYFDCKKNTDVISLYTDVLKFSLLISGSLYIVLFLIVFSIDSDSLFLIKKKYFYIVFIISWLGVFVNNASSLMTARQEAKKITVLTMITSFIGLLLNVLLIGTCKDKIFAFFLASFFTRGLQVLIYIYMTKNFFSWTSAKFFKFNEMVRYSVVRMPLELSAFATTFADRVMLYNLKTSYDAGIYSVGYKIGSIASIIMMSINTAMVPHFFEKLSEKEPGYTEIEKLSFRVFTVFSLIIFCLSIVINDIFIFLDTRYVSANIVVLLILYSFYFEGMKLVFQVPLDYNVRYAKYKSISWFCISIFNILCNFIFIPYFGVYGAALATLLSYMLILPFIIFLSYRASPIRLDKKTILIALITFIGGAFIFIKASIYLFIIKLLLCFLVCFLFMFFLRIDVSYILNLFKRK